MTGNASRTVRDVVVEMPGATRLFERLGIDYCCGGGQTLQAACAAAGITDEEFRRLLDEVGPAPEAIEAERDWQAESLTDLVAYILRQHHGFTRSELERVTPLLEQVSAVHGERHPELRPLQAVFAALKAELLSHMLKEEQILFPYIGQLEEAAQANRLVPAPFFGTVRNPVLMLMQEHDAAGAMLKKLRDLSANYTVPSDGCQSFQTLYEALRGLERDLHQHIHLENNILFPRAVGLEAAGR